MSRVADSYQSVTRGVSEQVPQDRRPGQHYEQINLISDPVRGLARRHGSVNMHEKRIRAHSDAAYVAMLADTQGHKVFPFQCNGSDYDLIYRTRSSTGQVADDFCWCYNKNTNRFIPVVADSSPLVTALKAGGTSAIVNVGKYVFIAGNNTVPAFDGVDTWGATQKYMVGWVRAGAYARTFTLTFTHADGTTHAVSYKTPTSAYPGVLDTSAIASSDPEYQKKVNDITNAYNTAVTQWIGTSAAAIVPSAIAEQLRLACVADVALTGITTGRSDATITFVVDTTASNHIVEVSCDDSGDGTLFRAVGSAVTAAELVSTTHFAGKIVQVRPKKNDGSDVYYLKANPKVAAASGWTDVIWNEAAGYEVTPKDMYGMATVIGETFYLAGSAALLTTLAGGTHPAPIVNGVGDRASSPIPTFFGKRIDFMALFQDKLVIGAGAVLYFSRTGDYQNLWRQSVLTIDPADPIEMFALGAEDDTIKAATTYDRNMLIFGRRKQYVVSGRQPLTPSNASIVVQSAHEDAVDAFPVNSGNFVFYNKFRNGVASAHQVQIGQLVDTPESYEISKQLDRYLKGKPAEIVAVTSPNVAMLRTETQRDRVYVYTYLDSAAGSERLFDAWATWVFNPGIGSMVGLSQYQGDIIGYTVRKGQSHSDGTPQIYLVADKYVLDTSLSEKPYLDSMRLASTLDGAAETSLSRLTPNALTDAALAFDNTVPEYLLGNPLSLVDDFNSEYPNNPEAKWIGWNYDAFVTPTNPYILDSNQKAIVTGRLTLTKVSVSIADSGGLSATMTTANGTTMPTDFTGRLIGRSTNLVGRQPIVTTQVTVPLGREVRDFTYTLSARRWLPLTITAIEWTGQFFNNTRRV